MIDFVYIMSASHSGSTLLTLLLASHPDVASVGETSAVLGNGRADSSTCSCGQRLDACAFWRQVRREMARRGVDWNAPSFGTEFRLANSRWVDRLLRAEYRGPLFEAARDVMLGLSPGWRSQSPKMYAANRALVESVMQLSGARVFLDSSKEPHRLKFLLRIRELNARVIHLVRDGRGVARSYMRRDGWSLSRATDEWRRSIVSERHLLRRMRADAVCRIRYEDLCRDVDGSVSRVLTFLGVDTSAWVRDYRSVEHHVLGNRMRQGTSSEVTEDARWREELTAAQLTEFDRLAGNLNRSYGYVD